MRFKIKWASLIVGRKFTVLALFYFVFEGNFPSTSTRGAYIWGGRFNGGFFWGAYVWIRLYMEGLILGILRYTISLSSVLSRLSFCCGRLLKSVKVGEDLILCAK